LLYFSFVYVEDAGDPILPHPRRRTSHPRKNGLATFASFPSMPSFSWAAALAAPTVSGAATLVANEATARGYTMLAPAFTALRRRSPRPTEMLFRMPSRLLLSLWLVVWPRPHPTHSHVPTQQLPLHLRTLPQVLSQVLQPVRAWLLSQSVACPAILHEHRHKTSRLQSPHVRSMIPSATIPSRLSAPSTMARILHPSLIRLSRRLLIIR
jgi:hypothetical protein